ALRTVESCSLLLVMRADFYPDLMDCALWPVDLSQRLEIASLRGEPLRQAIEQPAKDVGVHLEARLLERLVADAADEPGALPLAQETMVILWDDMECDLKGGFRLLLSAYERLCTEGSGGLAVAMARKADHAWDGLTDAEQKIARRILLRLVQF